MNKLFLVAATLSLASCATQQPLTKATQSGRAEASFKGASLERVRNEMVLACARTGGNVESNQYTITCSKEMEGNRAFWAQALLGNAYSGTPIEKLQFTMAPTTNEVFVTAAGWLEINNGFGNIRRVDYDNNNFQNKVQAALDGAAARLDAMPPEQARSDVPTDPAHPAPSPSKAAYERDPAKRCDACSNLTP